MPQLEQDASPRPTLFGLDPDCACGGTGLVTRLVSGAYDAEDARVGTTGPEVCDCLLRVWRLCAFAEERNAAVAFAREDEAIWTASIAWGVSESLTGHGRSPREALDDLAQATGTYE